MAEEFKTITTQEELDRIIADRLARERKKYDGFDGYKADSEALKALQAQDLPGQVTKLTEQVSRLTADLQAEKDKSAAANLALLRGRIAREAGLPDALADRLTGADEKALRKDAETLAGLVNAGQKPAPMAEAESGSGGGVWGEMLGRLK